MKKLIRFSGLTVVLALLIVFVAACDSEPEPPALVNVNLGVPANVAITVVERTMTVTWNAVPNAQGYEIYTTSEGCGSGNRLINTKDKTAYGLTGDSSYLKTDKSNGAVEILGSTKIQITLMPMGTGNENKPMASAVTAKVRAIGGVDGDNNYISSGYSTVADKALGGMGM
jgi:hypothetical protein